MDIDIHDNLKLLHRVEESIRAQSIEAIQASESFPLHAGLIEHTMSLMKFFIQEHQSECADVRTAKLLGIRLFNAAASVWKLLLSGYHQTSALQQRDMIETIFLLDYFRTDHSLIAVWRESTDEVRRKKFSPAVVRKALDERDGFEKSKRYDAYKMLSEMAAHPTYLGFHMFTDKPGGDINTGPFFDFKLFKAGLEELAKHLALAGGIFMNLFPQSPADTGVRLIYVEAQGHWAELFTGRAPQRSKVF